MSPEEYAANASTIFTGIAREVSTEYQQTSAHFDVITAVKGMTEKTATVSTAELGGMCGVDFQKGSTYLVYANERNGMLTTSICMGTHNIVEDSASFSEETREYKITHIKTVIIATLLSLIAGIGIGFIAQKITK
jgi:predicted membrane protein